MNAIIIDDEKNGIEVLQLLIAEHCKNVTVIAVEDSAEAGINAILNLKPDLVYLDIEMPTATGFDVIEATKGIPYEIIFTTAYENYAIKAFKAQAVDYLLKPIDIESLITATKNAQLRTEAKNKNNEPGQLELLLRQINYTPKKILIPTSEGVIIVAADNIIHLQSDSNYTNVFLKDGRKILISKTLKSMEVQLKDHRFCRVHSAHLVNVDEIDKYIKGDGGTLILKNKASVPVSRAHRQDLLTMIGFE